MTEEETFHLGKYTLLSSLEIIHYYMDMKFENLPDYLFVVAGVVEASSLVVSLVLLEVLEAMEGV